MRKNKMKASRPTCTRSLSAAKSQCDILDEIFVVCCVVTLIWNLKYKISTWGTFRCGRPGAHKRHSEAVSNEVSQSPLLPSFFG